MFVVQQKIPKTTMQAQPIIGIKALLNGKRTYKITLAKFIENSEKAEVAHLPEEILRGWFAHELGHVMDYEIHSNFGMIRFGLKYLFSEKYKKAVEHKADQYAIENGFGADIIKTKRFIYASDLFSEQYKENMKTYYMSIEEAQRQLKAFEDLNPV